MNIQTRFVNRRQIGAGNYGVVFSAHDTLTNRDVAIKAASLDWLEENEIPIDEDEYRALQEFKGVPNIIQIVDPGFVIDQPSRQVLLFTELYEGTLVDLVKRRGKTPAVLNLVLPQCVAGLTAMHERHYMHADIKPENILYRGDLVVLGDLGLALDMTSEAAKKLDHVLDNGRCTMELRTYGTPWYFSWLRGVNVPAKSGSCLVYAGDMESLAVALWVAFVGKIPPFGEGALFATAPDIELRRTNPVQYAIKELGHRARAEQVDAANIKLALQIEDEDKEHFDRIRQANKRADDRDKARKAKARAKSRSKRPKRKARMSTSAKPKSKTVKRKPKSKTVKRKPKSKTVKRKPRKSTSAKPKSKTVKRKPRSKKRAV